MNTKNVKTGDYYIKFEYVAMYNKVFYTTFVVEDIDCLEKDEKPTLRIKLVQYNLIPPNQRGNRKTWWQNELTDYNVMVNKMETNK